MYSTYTLVSQTMNVEFICFCFILLQYEIFLLNLSYGVFLKLWIFLSCFQYIHWYWNCGRFKYVYLRLISKYIKGPDYLKFSSVGFGRVKTANEPCLLSNVPWYLQIVTFSVFLFIPTGLLYAVEHSYVHSHTCKFSKYWNTHYLSVPWYRATDKK